MTEVLPPARRASRGAKVALAVGLLVVVAIAAAVSIKAMVSARASQQHTVSYSSQVVLPFAHLNKPWGAAVDGAGNLYIADHNTHQLLKLAAGASAPTPLPSTGLSDPTDVAVDSAGNGPESHGGWTRLNERSLEDIAAPALPEGFQFRTAAEGSQAAAQAHIDAWYPSTYSLEAHEGVRHTATYRDDLHIVVEALDGTMAASAIMWLDEVNRTIEFEPVGTHRDFRRQGLAQAILLHGMLVARDAGATHATVACLGEPGNAALRLYECVGFREFNLRRHSAEAQIRLAMRRWLERCSNGMRRAGHDVKCSRFSLRRVPGVNTVDTKTGDVYPQDP